MMVSPQVGSFLFYLSIVLAAAGVIAIRVRRPRETSSHVPGAVVVETTARHLRRLAIRWLPLVAIAAGLGSAWWLYGSSHQVVVVTDGPEGPRVVRKVHLGATSYATAAPTDDARPGLDDPTWVVNQSARTVRVETRQYGGSIGFGGDPTEIPSGTAAPVSRVDYIGPDNSPPDSIESDSVLHMDWRYWLTWDDR